MLNKKNILFLLLLVAALGERLFFDLGANAELITTGFILLSLYANKKYSFIFVLIAMIVSDLVLGNTNIYLFTWTGFLIPAVLAGNFINKQNKLFTTLSAGLGSVLFFYLWSNFGVWALDSWGMYSNDLGGLISSYINALPFLKNQLLSTLIFVPVGVGLVESIRLVRWFSKPRQKFPDPGLLSY